MAAKIVVGIAGGSASGKSTLAVALSDFLTRDEPQRRVEILSADAFFKQDKTQAPVFVSPSTGEEHLNRNHPDSTDNPRLIAAIEAHMLAEASDVLLVEGLMVLQITEIREKLDLRLFIELDADERALRRLLRDMKGGRASTDPQFIAAYYLECARVGHYHFVEPSRSHADLIVRGDADFKRVVPMLAAVIQTRLHTDLTQN
jgi:uridine kinase